MTRDPERRLLQDIVRVKRERNAARGQVEQLEILAAGLRADLVTSLVGGRLLRVEDFHLHIGMQAVTGADGQVDRRQLETRLSDLLRRRPELAAVSSPPRPS